MKALLLFVGSVVLVACSEQPLAPDVRSAERAVVADRQVDALCTKADAQITFNSWAGALRLGLGGPDKARPAEAFTRCQYRLFFDGETVTFRAGDVFLGGVNLFYGIDELKEMGATRQMGIASLDAIEARVWISRVVAGYPGDAVELPVMRTPFKNGMLPDGTLVVQQSRGFTASLPPGDYLSIAVFNVPAFLSFPAEYFVSTMHLVITP